MILIALAMQVVTTPAPVANKRGVPRVTSYMARTMGLPFDAVLTLCPDAPPYTYRYRDGVCPVVEPKPTPPVTSPNVNGALHVVRGIQRGQTIGPARINGAYRLVEAASGSSLRDSTIKGLRGNVERDGIRLRDAQGVTISDFAMTMRAAPQTGTHLPEGIAIGTGSNITIRDGVLSGFRMTPVKGKYTNGDGIATERGSSGTIANVVSLHNSDAGFDLKGDWRLDRVTAANNFRGVRIWGDSTAGVITASNNGQAIWLADNASLTIDYLVARSDEPATVIAHEAGATITIRACDLTGMAAGSKLIQADGRAKAVSLGDGCVLGTSK